MQFKSSDPEQSGRQNPDLLRLGRDHVGISTVAAYEFDLPTCRSSN
jgi:hypothetical protein